MRRRKDPFEKPWVIIAAVVGIVTVIAFGLIFFLGGTSPSPGESVPAITTSATSSAQQTLAAGESPSVIRTQVPVTIPAQGVFVRVNYIGGFTGRYGTEGNMTTTRNSGNRFFAIENATGTVSATFQKEDASTRHEIVVEIYRDGKSQIAAKNSSSYGIASVTYTI